MFTLQRVYAFTVTPQRGVDEEARTEPEGGPVAITQPLREVIQAAFDKVARGVRTTVDFELDASRSNVVRDDVLQVAFGATKTPSAAAARLASRLAQTMDKRSHAALLVVVVEDDTPKRRVSLVVLPREDVVQLGRGGEDVLINVLRDAFSTGSHLRKLARLEGHSSRTQFLSAEILDFQLASAHKSTADFWIRTFLAARPRIDSQAGSRHLAAALQRAFETSPADDRDAVSAAMLKARAGTVRSTSLDRFAENELPESVHKAYFGTNNDELNGAVFAVDRAVMQESLARYVITGLDGVVISAPAEAMGKSVEIEKRGQSRVVSYRGTVEKERVARDRRGARAAEKPGGNADRGRRSRR
ncbi:MAG: hypothetical protein H0T89_11570 [Deltaproteobacteria bacterium]|nr:hypothetical protein [Deltaproteobacteria bacterium]